jgi:nickel-type superoxide dismutase maturation protease
MFIIRRVEGLSMLPSFSHGKIVVGWRFRQPRVGDVVIARHHRVEVIKRISEMQDGQVFLLGDNAEESTDSRQFGWLPSHAIVAVVVTRRRVV